MPYSDQVDAEPVRRHVQQLVDAGMSVTQIQFKSGVNRTCIRALLGEHPGRPASKQVRQETASRLLRVKLDRGSCIEGLVPTAGTQRRLRALQAIGYPYTDLARRLGAGQNTRTVQLCRGELVQAEKARRVDELYRELADTAGPSSRTRELARIRGWLPPVWWDDDIIDDPLAEPEGIREYVADGLVLLDDVTLPRAERVALMSRRGLSEDEIAERIGTLRRYVFRDRLEAGIRPASGRRYVSARANRKKKLPPAEDLEFLLESGETIATIALRYGVTEGGVEVALRRRPAA